MAASPFGGGSKRVDPIEAGNSHAASSRGMRFGASRKIDGSKRPTTQRQYLMNHAMRSGAKSVGRWILGILFVFGGCLHFARPDRYMKVMPDSLPYHREIVLISGVFEVALGLMLLVRVTRRPAAWGLIALLIAIFPANLDMFLHPEKSGISPILLGLRLPLQGLLIAWAWAYTGPEPGPSRSP
jgi:uncharacterized membrane protein